MWSKMKVEVLILIVCDEKFERAQKYQACTLIEKRVRRVHGIENTSYTGIAGADITAFAYWEEKEIPQYVKEIENIDGIVKVTAKILVTA